MQTISYTEIENANVEDIGRVAIMWANGPVLGIGDDLAEAVAEATRATGDDDWSMVDDHTDRANWTIDMLVAVEVGDRPMESGDWRCDRCHRVWSDAFGYAEVGTEYWCEACCEEAGIEPDLVP